MSKHLAPELVSAHVQSKIPKYSLKQLKALATSELNFFLQSENDVKDLSTNQVVQLISAFLAEVTISPNVLMANYDPGVFEGEEIPYHFERLDETLRVVNANLVFYQLVAQVCQHVQYDFEMLLHPGRYEKEWRQIISLLVHFTLFKKEYEQRHLDMAEESKSSTERLRELTANVTALIERKR